MQVKGYFTRSNGTTVQVEGTITRHYAIAIELYLSDGRPSGKYHTIEMYEVRTATGKMHIQVAHATKIETPKVVKSFEAPAGRRALVKVGKGKALHLPVWGEAIDEVLGAKCGAGKQRGLRKSSDYTVVRTQDTANCPRCLKTV